MVLGLKLTYLLSTRDQVIKSVIEHPQQRDFSGAWQEKKVIEKKQCLEVTELEPVTSWRVSLSWALNNSSEPKCSSLQCVTEEELLSFIRQTFWNSSDQHCHFLSLKTHLFMLSFCRFQPQKLSEIFSSTCACEVSLCCSHRDGVGAVSNTCIFNDSRCHCLAEERPKRHREHFHFKMRTCKLELNPVYCSVRNSHKFLLTQTKLSVLVFQADAVHVGNFEDTPRGSWSISIQSSRKLDWIQTEDNKYRMWSAPEPHCVCSRSYQFMTKEFILNLWLSSSQMVEVFTHHTGAGVANVSTAKCESLIFLRRVESELFLWNVNSKFAKRHVWSRFLRSVTYRDLCFFFRSHHFTAFLTRLKQARYVSGHVVSNQVLDTAYEIELNMHKY